MKKVITEDVTTISNFQSFSTFKDGRLTSNLGLTNFGSLTFCM